MNVKHTIQKRLQRVVFQAWPFLKDRDLPVDVTYPPDDRFGHYSSNIAMQLAPILRQKPIEIAEHIRKQISSLPPIETIEIVQPGFLNFYLKNSWLARQIAVILKDKKDFGRSTEGKGKRVQLEFISANPTGPLHIGNGRGGFAGDVLSNVLDLSGYSVQREYYLNDTGKQVGVLAESVLRRYWFHKGIKVDYPDYCYQGTYIDDLAKNLYLPNYTFGGPEKFEDVRERIKGRILKQMIKEIRAVVEKKMGIKFDRWFSEKTLYTSGTVDSLLAELKERNLLYKSEGAIWLKTSQFGDDKDRVLVKANEEPVYFLSDVAYHWDKFAQRKFDRVIDIFGADHHGYIGRLQAVMRIFEFDGKLDILIAQLVRLMKDGEEFKMSKRAGTFVTIEELIDEVGVDAARFFFLMHDFTTHMDFDIDLAKKRSQDNPVYYVQYAHARICSILKRAKKLTVMPSDARAVMEPAEQALIKTLIKWPEVVSDVAASYQVHKLTYYATELATRFHDFYTQCRVINGQKVNDRRRDIIQATQIVLQNVLDIMGINAPERM